MLRAERQSAQMSKITNDGWGTVAVLSVQPSVTPVRMVFFTS